METTRRERIDRGLKARTEGIYAVSSLEEIIYLVGPRLVLIAGVLLLPLILEARALLEEGRQYHVRICDPRYRL